MDAPRLEELKPGKLIGHGGSGRVFQARDSHGDDCAVKVFDRAAVSQALLETATSRLESGGWPAGVMPVKAGDFAAEPPCWITPLFADRDDKGDPVARNLQNRLDDHPGTTSWKLVKSLARALAQMHERRVVHGNLKPGNVFFASDGELLLTDWAMGNMPGIAKFRFTDAVLHQPPEQLRDPSVYHGDAGYRCDVFAFGVLSFRILTGRFPRCHEMFKAVAPLPGAAYKEGIQADLGKIARNLEAQETFTWPDGPRNALEAGFRDWIDRCLPLDPARRPATMIEVAAGFGALEKKTSRDGERELLLDQRRHAEQRAWRARFFGGFAALSTVAIGTLWYLSYLEQKDDRRNRAAELNALRNAAGTDARSVDDLRRQLAAAGQALKAEQQSSMARLKASRQTGDQLFEWAMEKGNRDLPPLDGREVRLGRLKGYFQEFLKTSQGVGTLEAERSRASLQLAEIAISAGDSPAAGKLLGDAVTGWRGTPLDGALKMRLARDWLLLALLRQSGGDPDTGALFVAARKALEDVPQAEVDSDKLHETLAALDFHEAQLLSSRGDDRQALEQLMRATETLNRLADHRPDQALLRSELAQCYLASATVLEGMGNPGDAREVRSLATGELKKLLKEKPRDYRLRLDLAGCYGAMAESAVLSGDVTGAESISQAATELLDRLIIEKPDNVEAVLRKATQLGLMAGIQRDRGQAKEALKGYDEGIRMLETLHASAPDNAAVSFRLAQLGWQKGRMLGMAGERDKEIILIGDARELLASLGTGDTGTGPRPELIRSSLGYLLGDLGHSLQLAGRKDDSRKTFAEAVALFEKLLETRPQSEEYGEGLAWCRKRLDDLK